MSSVFHRRTDQFSFELGKLVLQYAERDFEHVTSVGKKNLPSVRARVRGEYYQRILDHWLMTMDNIEDMRELMLRTDSYGIDARKVMPFIGIITKEEREQALARARQLMDEV